MMILGKDCQLDSSRGGRAREVRIEVEIEGKERIEMVGGGEMRCIDVDPSINHLFIYTPNTLTHFISILL